MFPCKCVSLIPRLAEGVSINVTRGGKRVIEGRTLLKRHCNDKNICTCLDFFMIFFFFFFSSFFLFFFSLFFLIRVTSTPVSPFRLTFCSSSFSVPLFSFFSPLILFRLLYIYVSRRFPHPCFFPCCDAIFISLALFYAGNIILFTVSKIKPAFFFFFGC